MVETSKKQFVMTRAHVLAERLLAERLGDTWLCNFKDECTFEEFLDFEIENVLNEIRMELGLLEPFGATLDEDFELPLQA